MPILANYHGIDVEVTGQSNRPGRVTVRALYGEPFVDDTGDYSSTTAVSPFELSACPSDNPGEFSAAVTIAC